MVMMLSKLHSVLSVAWWEKKWGRFLTCFRCNFLVALLAPWAVRQSHKRDFFAHNL